MELEVLSGIKAETDAEIIAAAGAVLARGTYAVAVSLGKRFNLAVVLCKMRNLLYNETQ